MTCLLAGCFVFVEAGFCTPQPSSINKAYCSAEHLSPLSSISLRNDEQATLVQKLSLAILAGSSLLLVQEIGQTIQTFKKPDDRVLARFGPYQKWYPALVPSEQ